MYNFSLKNENERKKKRENLRCEKKNGKGQVMEQTHYHYPLFFPVFQHHKSPTPTKIKGLAYTKREEIEWGKNKKRKKKKHDGCIAAHTTL